MGLITPSVRADVIRRICVGGILLRGDTILLGKRAAARQYYPNVCDVFGGHREPHEQPEDTLIRELREELGITPTGFALLDVLDDLHPEPDGVPSLYIYVVTEWPGTPLNILPQEHSEIYWFTLREALQLELAHPSYPALFSRLSKPGEL